MDGKFVTQNQEKAFLLYTRAANEDDVYGKYKLAMCYYNGFGTGINYEQAFNILNTLTNSVYQDDVNVKLGICYLLGQGTNTDYDKALEYLSKAESKNKGEAIHYIGIYYLLNKKYKKAFQKFLKASEIGFTESKYQCGLCYLNGIGTKKNYPLACTYFKAANRDNYIPATIKYAECNYFGIGTETDYVKAVKLFLKGTKFNNSVAQNYMGICNFYGNGTMKNYSKACEFFALAKNKGNLTAVNNLAMCYKNNCGVHQNNAAAFENFKIGISDSPVCQYNLALCYKNGLGTEQNQYAYFSNIKLAASAKFPKALKELAEIYKEGKIIKKNNIKYLKYSIMAKKAEKSELFIDYITD